MIIQKIGKKMLKISADFVSQVINKEKKKILMEAGKGKKAREEIQ